MTTNTTPRACEHADSSAVEFAHCGQPQEWVCESDCGTYFTRTKPHHVFQFTLHEGGCPRQHLPSSWCDCIKRKTAGCVDCDREFPLDTMTNVDGPDPVIMFD